MGYKAIYAYAWDVAEIGVSAAVDRFLGLGLDTVTIAGSYHAGKFLDRMAKAARSIFRRTERSISSPTSAATARSSRSRTRCFRAGQDMVRELVGQSRMATNVWLVLLHNTRLGAEHPRFRRRQRLRRSLRLQSLPFRARGARLRDRPRARRHRVLSRQRRVVGDARFPALSRTASITNSRSTRPNRWLDSQLGLCFCPHCMAGAKSAGIRVEALKRQVAADIEAYLDSDVDFPADMAEAFWTADVRSDGDLRAYLDWRCTVVTSLVREIRDAVRKDATVAVIPSVARPTSGAWYRRQRPGGARGRGRNHRGVLLRTRRRADQSRPFRREAPLARIGPTARHRAARLPRSGIQRRIPRGDARARRRRRAAKSRSTIGVI